MIARARNAKRVPTVTSRRVRGRTPGCNHICASLCNVPLIASIAGLGNVPSATISMEGTAEVSWRSYTRSGIKPQAANKRP
jgi:hypothetical protein